MIISKCQSCGKDFEHYRSAKRKYCNPLCAAGVGNKARWKDKIPVKFICAICTKEFFVRPSRAARGNVTYCSYICHQVGEERKSGKIVKEIKRRTAVPGKSYPKIGGRHAHRIVAEKKIGRPLLPGEIVHHINENKWDYSEENLQILPNQAAHAKLHIHKMLAIRKPRKINLFPIICEVCEKEFLVHRHRISTAKHCSRLCHNQMAARRKCIAKSN